MKKLATFMIAAVIALFGAFGLVACDNDPPETPEKPGPSAPIWNAANDGTYYFCTTGTHDENTYFVIEDGKITAAVLWGDSADAEMEYDKSDITISAEAGEGLVQVMYGTIGDGVICITHSKMYENGELAGESNQTEYYCKKGVYPPKKEPAGAENDGRYYLYLRGQKIDFVYMEIEDGEVALYSEGETFDGEIEIDGNSIKLTITYENQIQISTGTIENGVICLDHHEFYDLEGNTLHVESDKNYYCKDGATPPADGPVLGDEYDGTYYFLKEDGTYNKEVYLLIENGELTLVGEGSSNPAEMEIDGENITITHTVFGANVVVTSYGTIKDGVIALTYHEMYMDGELVNESNETEYYCKEGVTPPNKA